MDFLTAISRVLGNEGGYVDDPNDPGGETNWGISKREYPDVDVAGLTRDEAMAIYNHDFWMPLRGAALPDSVAYQVLDFAVNSGIQTAIRALQKSAGVAADGVPGPVTMAALHKASPHDLLARFLAERLDFITRLKHWPEFGRGWTRRIAQNLRYSTEDIE